MHRTGVLKLLPKHINSEKSDSPQTLIQSRIFLTQLNHISKGFQKNSEIVGWEPLPERNAAAAAASDTKAKEEFQSRIALGGPQPARPLA